MVVVFHPTSGSAIFEKGKHFAISNAAKSERSHLSFFFFFKHPSDTLAYDLCWNTLCTQPPKSLWGKFPSVGHIHSQPPGTNHFSTYLWSSALLWREEKKKPFARFFQNTLRVRGSHSSHRPPVTWIAGRSKLCNIKYIFTARRCTCTSKRLISYLWYEQFLMFQRSIDKNKSVKMYSEVLPLFQHVRSGNYELKEIWLYVYSLF